MSYAYTYNFDQFLNNIVNTDRLIIEITESSIPIALDFIETINEECNIWFKDELSSDSSAILTTIVENHTGEQLPEYDGPRMPDGRPIVRADTRPLNTETIFTGCGDSTGIGDGVELLWDFSNNDDLYTGIEVPNGYKCKQLLLSFTCPVYLKDGTIYFFDAPWGAYINMDIVVPQGNYYPNPAGNIPASALGLSGSMMYSYATENVPYQRYVQKQRMYGSCPMGDELNAEGAAINALPIGWYIRGLIFTPESDNTSKGYATLEMYRCHTMLLPGQTIDSIH